MSMRLKINEGFPGERSIVLPKMIKEIEQKDPVLSQLYITDIGYYPLTSSLRTPKVFVKEFSYFLMPCH